MLLVSERGKGKSILITELGMRGADYISGEQTLVDDRFIIGGTRMLSNRVSCLKNHYPELIKDKGYSYEEKIWYDPEELGMHISDLPVKIGKMSFIDVDDDFDFSCKRLEKDESLIRLFHNINSTIRSTERVIMNFKEPVPSFDDATLSKKRLKFLKGLISELEIVEARGSAGDLADYILGGLDES